MSDFTAGVPNPRLRLITPNENRPVWAGPGARSALKLFGRDTVYVSDEVYGSATAPGHGMPPGRARTIDVSEPATLAVQGEYKLEENFVENCPRSEPRPRTSYSAHNPTATANIVFTTWHSGGAQAISVADPKNPYQLAEFLPTLRGRVAIEDPRLSSDPDTGKGEKVVMWSYPIIRDGLIYVVDPRNGLYILEYDGPSDAEVCPLPSTVFTARLRFAATSKPTPAARWCPLRRTRILPRATPAPDSAWARTATCSCSGARTRRARSSVPSWASRVDLGAPPSALRRSGGPAARRSQAVSVCFVPASPSCLRRQSDDRRGRRGRGRRGPGRGA